VTTEVEHGYAKGRAKRREIMDEAMALFGEVGYRGASLREIAARCGISHPGLLHHFPTKESLLLAVLAHRDEVDGEWLAMDGTTGTEKLRRLIDLVFLNATRRGIVELFAVLSAEATSPDHPAHAFFVERYRNAVQAAELTYAQVHDEGRLRPGIDPGASARQLIALMDGLQVQWLLDGRETDMAGVVHAHINAQLTVPL
jgi:AcrR family transcriptional regulator